MCDKLACAIINLKQGVIVAAQKCSLCWDAFWHSDAPKHGASVLETLFYVHTVVENADHNNTGFRAGSIKDDMTALAILLVPRLYVFRIAANIRLARKQPEGIVKLFEVFIALALSPLFRGKAPDMNNVFSSSGGEQERGHQ